MRNWLRGRGWFRSSALRICLSDIIKHIALCGDRCSRELMRISITARS